MTQALMDALLSTTFIGSASLVVALAVFGLMWHQHRLHRTRENVDVQLLWTEGSDPEYQQRGDVALSVNLELTATNLGGSKSPKGRVTVTLRPGWDILSSRTWEDAVPHAMMGEGAMAKSHELPRIAPHEKSPLPVLRVRPRHGGVDGASRSFPGHLQWGVSFGKQGATAGDLRFRLKVTRPQDR